MSENVIHLIASEHSLDIAYYLKLKSMIEEECLKFL